MWNREAEASATSTLTHRLARAASMTGLGTILSMALSVLGSIAVARNGGPTGYALFVLANMFIYVPAVVCSFGLPIALSKHVAGEEERGRHEALRRTATTTLLLLIAVSIIAGALIAATLPLFEQRLGVEIGRGFPLALPFLLACAVVSDSVQAIYYGLLRTRAVIAITAAGPLATIIYVLLRKAGLDLPIWGAVGVLYVVSGLVAVYKARRDRLLGRPAPLRDLRPILSDIVPSLIFTLFMTFTVWSDRWIAGINLGAVVLGSYSAAVVVIQAVLRVPRNMVVLLVPASTRAEIGGEERSSAFNRTTIGIFGLFAALMTTILMLAPAMIVQTIFGPGFALAAPALLVMTPTLLASAIYIPFISALTGSTRNRLVTYLLIFTALPRILLLLVLTKYWSLAGTAMATMLSDFLLAFCCIMLARTIGMHFPTGALVRPFLTGLIAYAVGLGLLLLGAPQLVAIAVAALFFLPGLWRIWLALKSQTLSGIKHA